MKKSKKINNEKIACKVLQVLKEMKYAGVDNRQKTNA